MSHKKNNEENTFFTNITNWVSETFTMTKSHNSSPPNKKKSNKNGRNETRKPTKKSNKRTPSAKSRTKRLYMKITYNENNNNPPTNDDIINIFQEAMTKGKFRKIQKQANNALKNKDIKEMRRLFKEVLPKY